MGHHAASVGALAPKLSDVLKGSASSSDTNHDIVTSFMCMTIASTISGTTDKSYSEVLNILLKANNLPRFNMGEFGDIRVRVPANFSLEDNKISVPDAAAPGFGQDDAGLIAETDVPDISRLSVDGPNNCRVSAVSLSSVSSVKQCTVFSRERVSGLTSSKLKNFVSGGSVFVEHCCSHTASCMRKIYNAKSISTLPSVRTVELNDKQFRERKSAFNAKLNEGRSIKV